MIKSLVSIIIPCYNAELFISDTLNSILNQDYRNIEIIVVDDGSTDLSVKIIEQISDDRLKLICQQNKGVSFARNAGLEMASGEFIVFFDNDDIMTKSYITAKLEYFNSHPDAMVVASEIFKIRGSSIEKESYFPAIDVFKDVLLYNPRVITCPSAYMYKVRFLKAHSIKFNLRLTYSADRYFLLECARFARFNLHSGDGFLLYRITDTGMSAKLTIQYVLDHEFYYDELIRNNLIPHSIKKQSLFLGYYIISASYFKLHEWKKSLIYALKCLRFSFIGLVVRLFKKIFG